MVHFYVLSFNCVTDALRRGSLLFTTKFPEIPGIHNIWGIWPQQPYHCPASGMPQYQPMKHFEYIGQVKEEIIPLWQPLYS